MTDLLDPEDLHAFATDRDPQAFGRLFAALFPRLQRIAWQLCRDAHAAEDALQTTFLAALRSAATYDPDRPLLPWLARILANRITNCLTQTTRRRTRESRLGADPVDEVDPARTVADAELRASVEAAITELPARYRTLLWQRLFEDLSAADIARTVGRSPDTVRSQLRRGLRLLRRRLPPGAAA